jgi:gamma-glutamyltranspeptidase/glutathione hydrolase
MCGLALVAAIPAPGNAAPDSQAAPTAPAAAVTRHPEKNATAYGTGGAVSSVDPEATNAGLHVLRGGGNAVDAAVATAAALGVTEPYSAGIGGGGYLVYYNAKSRKVTTLDGRETAPASMPGTAFIDRATGLPRPSKELYTSGLSVGVPGTPATWETALKRWGRLELKQALRPAERIAKHGFVVDATFRGQTEDNQERFAQISSTSALYLPGGQPPAVGSIFRNPELAKTYRALGRRGTKVLYRGRIGREIVATVKNPPKTASATLPVPAGYLKKSDLAAYRVKRRKPTKVTYRGLDVYSMGPSSSGGSTVGEALNILGTRRLSKLEREQALHYYLDASSLAYADRNAYVGDPAYVKVPLKTLLSRRFARSRACQIDPSATFATFPVPPGDLNGGGCLTGQTVGRNEPGTSTTHLVTADRWGNVVSYTLTIEQTGGNGIVVPGRGFLLNNELTDFSPLDVKTDPNRIQGGKRPRSSMAPTIVLKDGKPKLAIGSPGGATIITTVLQTLVNRVDFKMTLPHAVAEPRASSRNATPIPAEPAFVAKYGASLGQYGHKFEVLGDTFTSQNEIGAVAALEFFPHGRIQAVAEPVRRGGGDARVVRPRRP